MSRDNKEMKARRQAGQKAHAAMPEKPGVTKPSYSKYGAPRSQSPAYEPWDKTTERAIQARRSRNLKVTLPTMPWNKDDQS